MSKGKIGMRIGESVFCIAYLMFDFIATILFLKNGSNRLFLLYGIMTLILGFGDAFHLIPRVIRNIKGETEKIQWWMNFGLLITSITMTVFYIILFYIWKKLNVNLSGKVGLKVHSGEPNGPYFLRPNFLQPIYEHTQGTFLE